MVLPTWLKFGAMYLPLITVLLCWYRLLISSHRLASYARNKLAKRYARCSKFDSLTLGRILSRSPSFPPRTHPSDAHVRDFSHVGAYSWGCSCWRGLFRFFSLSLGINKAAPDRKRKLRSISQRNQFGREGHCFEQARSAVPVVPILF